MTVGGLKSSNQLEPGIDDAREILRQTEKLVAPVAWALFTEKSIWDELLFAGEEDGIVVDKGQPDYFYQPRALRTYGKSDKVYC